jgi:dihydrofolate synthase/folylpolyglutamate synthase
MNYEVAIEWLFNQFPSYQKIGKKAYKPDLTNIKSLCQELDIQFSKLNFIHVAGTNGKGTTTNMISSILIEEGYKVGTFTSPHIEDFRERIVINNKLISENLVINFCKKVKNTKFNISPSFFEITFAMALAHFENEKCDFCVIETGLGGRLDSTNIISPILTIITNISLDHTDILGNNLENIAYEKGGIIKNNIPVVIGEYNSETFPVFEKIAFNNKSKLIKAWETNLKTEAFINKEGYPFTNERTVRASIEELKSRIRISDKKIEQGIKNINKNTPYRGRFQKVCDFPKVILDVGHNEDGIRSALYMAQKDLQGKLYIIYGTSSDKDLNKIIPLFPLSAKIYFTEFSNQRSYKKSDFIQNTANNNTFLDFFGSIKEIYPKLKTTVNKEDTILVIGSFFLIQDFFSFFSSKDLQK